jgi:hypothetical protein
MNDWDFHYTKSQNNLDLANYAKDRKKDYNNYASRIYYSIYNTILAIISQKTGYKVPRGEENPHNATLLEFETILQNASYQKKDMKKLVDKIKTMKSYRIIADYKPVHIDSNDLVAIQLTYVEINGEMERIKQC